MIDRLAYQSKLKENSPFFKGLFALFSLVLCLCADSGAFALTIALVMCFACTVISGMKLGEYLRLCAIPFGFVAIGALTIAFRLTAVPSGLVSLPLFGRHLSLTGLEEAVLVLLRSMGCISCLYFLYITTPVNHLLGLLHRMRLPVIFLELTLMIYRFIFILTDMAGRMTTAQRSRLGNNGFGATLRSAAVLASTIFLNAFKKSEEILSAMESRGYDGTMAYLADLPPVTHREKRVLALYCASALLTLVLFRAVGV